MTERVLATVLFTDIVGFTQRLAEMGDQRWALLERHHGIVRTELAAGARFPRPAPLHDDPRFVALLERMGLAPVEAARAWMKGR